MKTQVRHLKEDIEAISKQIRQIQDSCPHPSDKVVKVANSDTGNWCRDDDRYWYDCRCNLCEKTWCEDQ